LASVVASGDYAGAGSSGSGGTVAPSGWVSLFNPFQWYAFLIKIFNLSNLDVVLADPISYPFHHSNKHFVSLYLIIKHIHL
jgi:hypothetical protein